MWRPFVVDASEGRSAVVRIEPDPNWEWKLEADGKPLGSGPDRWFLAAELRYWVVTRAIEGTRAVLLHASVVSRDGRALVAVAPSGGGKTTLSLALVERGWTYHGDDLAAIGPGSLEVTALPTPAGIRATGRWPELAPRWEGVAPWPPSSSFLIPAAGLDPRAGPLAPGVLAFLDYGPGHDLALEEVGAAEATVLCAEQMGRRTPAAVATLTAFCARSSCVRLSYGSSDAAASALEGHWESTK